MEEKTSIKELVFNERSYSRTKKILGFLVVVLLILTTKEKVENALVLLVTLTGSIFYLCKLSVYKTKRSKKDIILLIIYVSLLIIFILFITLPDF